MNVFREKSEHGMQGERKKWNKINRDTNGDLKSQNQYLVFHPKVIIYLKTLKKDPLT